MLHRVSLFVATSLVVAASTASSSHANQDRVLALPGLRQPLAGRLFSGYLRADTRAEGAQNFVHYMYYETKEPYEQPLFVITGSVEPGCSVLTHFLSGLGPLKIIETIGDYNDVDGDDSWVGVEPAPHSWSELGNLLVLDVPTETGYSYTLDADKKRGPLGDSDVRLELMVAFERFLDRFPRLQSSKLMLVGQSYGARFAIDMCNELLASNSPQEVKALVALSPDLDRELRAESQPLHYYAAGVFGAELWAQFSRDCCQNRYPSRRSCPRAESTPTCERTRAQILAASTSNDGHDVDNLWTDCRADLEACQAPKSEVPLNGEFAEPVRLLGYYPSCVNKAAIAGYLARRDVREALNVASANTTGWSRCNEQVAQRYDYSNAGLAGRLANCAKEHRVVLVSGDASGRNTWLHAHWWLGEQQQLTAASTMNASSGQSLLSLNNGNILGAITSVALRAPGDGADEPLRVAEHIMVRGAGEFPFHDQPAKTAQLLRSLTRSRKLPPANNGAPTR